MAFSQLVSQSKQLKNTLQKGKNSLVDFMMKGLMKKWIIEIGALKDLVISMAQVV